MADNRLTLKPETETEESTCDATTSSAVISGNPYVLAWHLQLFYAAAFVAMLVVAVAGNAVVMWIVVAHRRMRSVTNYFLVNLSLADGLQSIFNTLFNFVYLLHNDWRFGYTWCIFAQFSAPCTISASVFTFIAIAVDRYVIRLAPMQVTATEFKLSSGFGLVIYEGKLSSNQYLPMHDHKYVYFTGSTSVRTALQIIRVLFTVYVQVMM